MTEQELRAEVARTAQAWLGASQGSRDHATIVNLYNSYSPLPERNGKPYVLTYSDNWCAAFVSAVAVKLGLTDIMPVECSCTEMVALYQKLGRWEENDAHRPQVGDVIFYRWDDGTDYRTTDQRRSPNHVGIVVEVDGRNAFTVIEGNRVINGVSQVAYRTMEVNGRYIRGYGLPDYASKASKGGLYPGQWYDEAMTEARDLGLMDGTRPHDTVTRTELATVAVRLYHLIVSRLDT